MKESFRKQLIRLQSCLYGFDDMTNQTRYGVLKNLSKTGLHDAKDLLLYADYLLFMVSHPASRQQFFLVKKEIARLTAFLKKHGKTSSYEGSGLPYTITLTRFSFDILEWMLQRKKYRIELDSFTEDGSDLNDILKLTLPSLEREHTSAGYTYQELFSTLRVKKGEEVPFLIQQLGKFASQPLLKDHLFDSLDMYVKVHSNDKTFSRFYNILPFKEVFFHGEIIKRFNSASLIEQALPYPLDLGEPEREKVLACIKDSLVLTSRETDPATFCDPSSLRVYSLERGITVAIYGMTGDRQLPLESYVGYTLFKNNYPAAYGGCWVFGARSLFGINIFEPFRGGESGYMMCQILRVYRQVFGISYFEVEPYQFGKDNPDGIASGAYWFYHRFGFRSVDKQLHALSEKEQQKIIHKKRYRSSKKTLEAFTDSYIALQLGKKVPPAMSVLTGGIPALIQKRFNGNRALAEHKCVAAFLHEVKGFDMKPAGELNVLKEVALVAAALNLKKPIQFQLLGEMVQCKNQDVYRYQKILHAFCESL